MNSLLAFLLAIIASASSLFGQNSKSQDYVPPELQASEPEIKAYIELADKSARSGNYPGAFQQLQQALDVCTRKELLSDRALIEAKLGAAYFVQGKLEDARQQWLNSFSDSVKTENLVLQADTLVALSAMSLSTGNIDEAVKLETKALDLARKSKNFFIQSRCLGEFGSLYLTMGKRAEARTSVEEALKIDRLNHYNWEAGHILYLAWITAADPSALDQAMQLATAARELAVKQENYLVFMQASTSLAQGYLQKNRAKESIALLEHSRDGIDDHGKPLFPQPDSYRAAMALPLPKVAYLSAIAMAYQRGGRTDDALTIWLQLYDTAKLATFTLAEAEAAQEIAAIYAGKKDLPKAISFYALAAEGLAKGGNTGRRIDAIASEAFLLQQQGESEKAIHLYEELLPLLDAAGNHSRQFLIALTIAEIAQPRGDLNQASIALQQAESLLSTDHTIAGVEPKFIFELYTREAAIHQTRKDFLSLMIAMEKAIPSAEAGATKEQRAILDREMSTTLDSMDARETAAGAYASGDLTTALPLYELIQYFEETHARWSGVGADYNKKHDDPTVAKVLEIPFKLVEQTDGAATLDNNLRQMGPIAEMARLPILIALTTHYFPQARHDLVVKFATLALPHLRLGDDDQPNRWDVQLACELAVSLLFNKDTGAAAQRVGPCLRSAQKFDDPQLLTAAHQINVLIMQAAGRAAEAQDSVLFLAHNPPDNPQYYVQLAQFKAQQGLADESAEAWKQALELFEAQKDLKGAAWANMALANALRATKKGGKEVRDRLESALALFRQLGDVAGQARANMFLGDYFVQQEDATRAREHLDVALKQARQASDVNIQAYVLSAIGNAYRKGGEPMKALDSYHKAAELYRSLKDTADEASQTQNQADVLDDLHRSEEALETYLRAKRLADSSGSWVPRYWARRNLSSFYSTRGDYENALSNLWDARDIANTAHQPLNSAWASLALAQTLATVGEREDAVIALNLALPVIQEFKDVESEAAIYLEFIDIYGARESEFKDLEKALEYYQLALQLATKNDPERAVSLNLDMVEIYWQQKKFKEASSLANDALAYYRSHKDDWGQASALISLAEIQRSEGGLSASATSLARAEPLVKRSNNFYITGRFHYGLAQVHKQKGRYQEAIDEYKQVIGMVETIKSTADAGTRRTISNTYSFIYDELIDTYYQLGEQQPISKLAQADLALQQTELNKSRVFTTSWGRTFVEALRRQLPAAMQDRERSLSSRQDDLQSQLAQAQSGQGSRAVKQIQEDLKHLAVEFDLLAKEMRKVSPAYAEARFPEIGGIASVPLRPGEMFVEFKMLDDGLLVWMIQGTDGGARLISFYKVDHPRLWFEERILAIRSVFNRAVPEQFDPQIAEELFNGIFPPALAAQLTSAKNIMFAPDDILFLLPFELLSPEASHSQFVLMKVPTSYFPSAAALRLSRSIAPAKHDWQSQFFGLADPITSADDERYAAASIVSEVESMKPQAVPHGTQPEVRGPLSVDLKTRDYFFSRLPDTAVEVKNIAALFPAESSNTMIRTGMDAKKQELLETDLGRFRFIHFATHGFFPVESGIREPALVLSYDGKDQERMMLALSEIVQLRLHADMVVLSACNTGSGKVTRAEGVTSLGTAFLASGASSTTMSLWKVSDKSTAILMQEFYRNLLNGMPKSTALAAARSTLASQGYANPFYWAPFVLTGQ